MGFEIRGRGRGAGSRETGEEETAIVREGLCPHKLSFQAEETTQQRSKSTGIQCQLLRGIRSRANSTMGCGGNMEMEVAMAVEMVGEDLFPSV